MILKTDVVLKKQLQNDDVDKKVDVLNDKLDTSVNEAAAAKDDEGVVYPEGDLNPSTGSNEVKVSIVRDLMSLALQRDLNVIACCSIITGGGGWGQRGRG